MKRDPLDDAVCTGAELPPVLITTGAELPDCVAGPLLAINPSFAALAGVVDDTGRAGCSA
jgi:hypothetical protein